MLRFCAALHPGFQLTNSELLRVEFHCTCLQTTVGARSEDGICLIDNRNGLVREDVEAMSTEGSSRAVPPEAIVQFLANGLFGLLVWWLNGRLRLSVEEVDGISRRLAIPAVKAAMQ